MRPIPSGSNNIGNWQLIIEIIVFMSVFSNAGLIAYTSDVVKKDKMGSFLAISLILLSAKYLSKFIIPEKPEKANLINIRH
jgi:hypothetical protein